MLKPNKKVLFKLSGSIAAYKACFLISKLVQHGCEVQTVASQSLSQFIGMATLEGLTGKPVLTSVFEPGRQMEHIHLNRWADVTLLCPATARAINALATGAGEDVITTLFLAHEFKKPYWIVPAMNQAMYHHPATQRSLAMLREWGVTIIEGEEGHQACGETGMGRMAEPEAIFTRLQEEGVI